MFDRLRAHSLPASIAAAVAIAALIALISGGGMNTFFPAAIVGIVLSGFVLEFMGRNVSQVLLGAANELRLQFDRDHLKGRFRGRRVEVYAERNGGKRRARIEVQLPPDTELRITFENGLFDGPRGDLRIDADPDTATLVDDEVRGLVRSAGEGGTELELAHDRLTLVLPANPSRVEQLVAQVERLADLADAVENVTRNREYLERVAFGDSAEMTVRIAALRRLHGMARGKRRERRQRELYRRVQREAGELQLAAAMLRGERGLKAAVALCSDDSIDAAIRRDALVKLCPRDRNAALEGFDALMESLRDNHETDLLLVVLEHGSVDRKTAALDALLLVRWSGRSGPDSPADAGAHSWPCARRGRPCHRGDRGSHDADRGRARGASARG